MKTTRRAFVRALAALPLMGAASTVPALAEPALTTPAIMLARPSADDFVRTERQGNATRIVTPYYSVLVPDDFYGGLEGTSFVDQLTAISQMSGCYGSHYLSVRLNNCSLPFRVYCYDPATPGDGLDYVEAPVEGISCDGLAMRVAAAYHPSYFAGGLEAAKAFVQECAALVEETPAVYDWARPPQVKLEKTAEGMLLTTPHYTFAVPEGLDGEKFVLSYREGLPAEYAAASLCCGTHVLYVVLENAGPSSRHFELRCVPPDMEMPAYLGDGVLVSTGVFTDDGLEVYIALDGPEHASAEQFAEAGILARGWATLVGAVK